jgi:hypothetical protein
LQPELEKIGIHPFGPVAREQLGRLKGAELARSVQGREIGEVPVHHDRVGEQVLGTPPKDVDGIHPLIGMQAHAGPQVRLEPLDLTQNPGDPMGKTPEFDDRGGRRGRQVGDEVGTADALPVFKVVLDGIDDAGLGRDVGLVDPLEPKVLHGRHRGGVLLGLSLGTQLGDIKINLICNLLRVLPWHHHGQLTTTSVS